ncbi:ATP-binding protein [uncultured Roseobacter sp.]|uniref:ATP-dependent nuclease n=1 Tax=uncultured Roseobacter sp. TaxID=114847 RepID=UPI00261D5F68|nr:ATP-binding protein [uncultured Roseobacter sp.]
MQLNEVKIRNFKAIDSTTINLARMTVIVGANGSGKSSVLQALHWMFQSGRNLAVGTNAVKNEDYRQSDGSTLSEKDATYMPSPEYRNAGHGAEFGNKKGSPQMEVELSATNTNGDALNASMWIKSARNEGLSVHVPSNNAFVQSLRDQSKEFSSYIPGLAGIASVEEKRTKLIVHRQAAAGDANTVLRNVLLLLKGITHENETGLDLLMRFVSDVMGPITLTVDFIEDKHQTIQASFQTKVMGDADQSRRKPLELAGIGFLQVIQIFAYLVYFRPALLLVDEPDAHLHPTTQERLVTALDKAAQSFGTQVILTTHSPSIVRAVPNDARVVWMKNGAVQPDGDTSGRQLMGWGLLDKRVLLLTEDTKISMLRSLLSQWPDLERNVALWPLHGSGKLLDPKGCASLQTLFGEGMKIAIHRDRDFMMPDEAAAFSKPYSDSGIGVWLTKYSDVEAYWADTGAVAKHFQIDVQAAQQLIDSAASSARQENADVTVRNTKRIDIRNKIAECRNGTIGAFNDEQVVQEYSQDGQQHVVLGKTLCAKVRKQAKAKGYENVSSFGKSVFAELDQGMAEDLHNVIMQLMA